MASATKTAFGRLSAWLANPSFRRVAGTAFWLQVDKVAQMAVGFVVGVWLARYLGPDRFGVWSYALSLAAIVATLGRLGLDALLTRTVSLQAAPRGGIVGAAVSLRFLGTLGLAGMVAALFGILDGDRTILVLLAFLLPAAVVRAPESIEVLHIVDGRGGRILLARGGPLLLGAAIKIGLILAGAPLAYFAAATLVEAAVLAVCFSVSLRGAQARPTLPPWPAIRQLLKDALPLALSAAAVIIYMRIDMVMLGAMAPAEEVGIYAVAVRVAEASYFVPLAIIQAVTPSLVRAKAQGSDHYHLRLRQLLQALVLYSYAVGAVTLAIAGPLVTLLFGDAYAAAGLVLTLYIWSTVFVVLGSASSAHLLNEGLTWVLPTRTAIGALVNVGLNFVLIPHYGAVGATIATLVAYAIAAVLVHAAINAATRDLLVRQVRALLLLDVRRMGRRPAATTGPRGPS
ncbi:MAG: flippase [Rhodospirillaceae bacterium]|nr:flippase [Rhodospirillaceae bacterium]